jgi:hypothetical protein
LAATQPPRSNLTTPRRESAFRPDRRLLGNKRR